MKVIKWLDDHFEEVILAILLIGISFVMLAEVVARFVFRNALSWSDELARYLLVWSGFLSVSFCVKKRISIKIDQFQNALSPRMIPWVKMLRHTIVFIFCIIMIPYSLTYVQQAISSGATSSAMQIPMYIIQCAPLVCFILLAIRVAQAWVREFRVSWRFMLQTLKEELKAEIREELKQEEGGEDK